MTDQLLPDRLNAMDTAPGITDEELREILATILEQHARPGAAEECRSGIGFHEAIKAMRAVVSRTRPSTPTPDAMARDRDEWKEQHENLLAMYRAQSTELAEAIKILRPFAERAQITTVITAADVRRAAAFIATHTGEK